MATFILSDETQNLLCDAYAEYVDAGGAAGRIELYDGTPPGDPDTGPTTQTLLTTFTLPYPAFEASGWSATGKARLVSPVTATAVATGEPTWAIVYNSDDDAVALGDVGSIGDEAFVVNVETIVTGALVVLTHSVQMPSGS